MDKSATMKRPSGYFPKAAAELANAANGPATEPGAGAATEPMDKKPKTSPSEATVAKGNFVTFLNRVKDGRFKKRSSPQDMQEASTTLAQYNSLAQEDKAAFALDYCKNKDRKDFQWAREFIQRVHVKRQDEEKCVSKYMTRIFMIVNFGVRSWKLNHMRLSD